MDTQEFYQVIMRHIPAQIYDLYNHANYNKDLLFNLLVEKVVITPDQAECNVKRHEQQLRRCELIFENDPDNDLNLALFQAMGDYLLSLGLTTEASEQKIVPFDKA